MGLILLIVIGAIIGWLASIIARAEDHSSIVTQILLGMGVAVLVGTLTNSASILGGLSATALLATLAVTSLAMAVYNVFIRLRMNA